ncbi:MAG: hypothetical protein ACTHLA_04015 [Asticcacaulis sp.]|uniref:hypothetical protein n=1 Tax=Asticcacaulis sp. TaxID=1872648 RepID=UPI003F7BCF12
MKLYGIFPTIQVYKPADARAQRCIEIVADMVFTSLRWNGDHFHFALDWHDPESDPDMYGFHEDRALPHMVDLRDAEALRKRIAQMADPNIPGPGSVIRSIATCRAVLFGYDGQAFLCLRHEDPAPISSDPVLVVVEERPDILNETDYLDGFFLPGEQAKSSSGV